MRFTRMRTRSAYTDSRMYFAGMLMLLLAAMYLPDANRSVSSFAPILSYTAGGLLFLLAGYLT